MRSGADYRKSDRPKQVQRRVARSVSAWLAVGGFDPRVAFEGVRSIPRYFADLSRFRRLAKVDSQVRLLPRLHDQRKSAGAADGHYFWQDLIVSRWIHERLPGRHVDIGSRVDGFVAHLLVFMSVQLVDVRALASSDPALVFIVDDATQLSSVETASVVSLSCLHAVEHFGLGRYGDPIDPVGHINGLLSLQRVLAPGGHLYVSVPIGVAVVEFNNQRVLPPDLLPSVLSELVLNRFVAVPASGPPIYDRAPADFAQTSGWCGVYEFERPNRG